MKPIRIFIGTSSNGEDAKAELAYEYSLRKNTDRELDIVWMRQTNDENSFWHGFNDSRWSTPFSGFRWAIPEYCNFEGKAIYTDVDMLNFHDIGELYDLPIAPFQYCLARSGKRFEGKEFCVILFDNTKFKEMSKVNEWKKVDSAHQQFISLMTNSGLVGDLDPKWNSHDGDANPYYQLHFTKMSTQPWFPKWFTGIKESHPNQDLVDIWHTLYEEAVSSGINLENYNINRDVEYGIIGK